MRIQTMIFKQAYCRTEEKEQLGREELNEL